MAEAFNNYFSGVSKNLADEIPLPENEPEAYLEPTDTTFSLKSPSINTVYNLLLSIDEKKSVGLDRIPNKLLKIDSHVVAPSLTAIFATFSLECSHRNRKQIGCHQFIKVALGITRVIIDLSLYFPPLQKFLKKLFNFTNISMVLVF